MDDQGVGQVLDGLLLLNRDCFPASATVVSFDHFAGYHAFERRLEGLLVLDRAGERVKVVILADDVSAALAHQY